MIIKWKWFDQFNKQVLLIAVHIFFTFKYSKVRIRVKIEFFLVLKAWLSWANTILVIIYITEPTIVLNQVMLEQIFTNKCYDCHVARTNWQS